VTREPDICCLHHKPNQHYRDSLEDFLHMETRRSWHAILSRLDVAASPGGIRAIGCCDIGKTISKHPTLTRDCFIVTQKKHLSMHTNTCCQWCNLLSNKNQDFVPFTEMFSLHQSVKDHLELCKEMTLVTVTGGRLKQD
jgi:hypothetical protein